LGLFVCPKAHEHAQQAFSEDLIIKAGLTSVERALDCIYRQTVPGKQGLFEIWSPDLRKWLLWVDHDAQREAEDCLEKELPGIQIRGEEGSLQELREGPTALLDMLDGSDLLKRNLGNWCYFRHEHCQHLRNIHWNAK
jgi:hypothetical protein